MPPHDQLIADVKALVDMKLIESGDYWLANAAQGKSCDGAQVETLLIKMAQHFEPSAQTKETALEALAAKKVLFSPAYWQEHATTGRKCSGDNVRAVIRNFVRLAK